MSDGLSDAYHEGESARKLERAIHIMEEALTEYHDPMFGLHREALAMVMEAIERAKAGRRKCWHDCYDLEGHRRKQEGRKDTEYQSAWRFALEKALREVDPDLADRTKISTEEWLKEHGKHQ